MKHVLPLGIALLLACCFATDGYASQDLFSIQTFGAPSQQKECAVSVVSGEVLEFTPEDLERRMELATGGLRGLTVTDLPSDSQGTLVLQGVEVEPYQFIAREEIEELCFVPHESAAAASVTLLPQGEDGAATRLSIAVLGSANLPPAVEGGSFTTVRNMRFNGRLNISDPDGDAVLIKVMQHPQKGSVSFSGQGFVYEPYQDESGTDAFTVCAVDRFGSFSPETSIHMKIERNRASFSFVDMVGNPSQYAAYKLHEKGVLSGEQAGGNWYFYPQREVLRGEFLIMLLSSTGKNGDLPATVNTGLANDDALPVWFKPYVQKAIDEGIISATKPFADKEIPTRAEAVQMTALAANITDVKDFSLQMTDASAIPEWALASYKQLAAYRMLDLHDRLAYPAKALDRSYAADLIWQLYKHCQESE